MQNPNLPRILLVMLVSLLMASAACAGEVFVSNKPYQGRVAGSGSGMQFVLSELAEALQLEIDQKGEGWTLGGVPVSTRIQENEVWIELSALPDTVVRVIQSAELNTVDLYSMQVLNERPKGNWGGEGTVVYFYATWSPPCRAMETTIQALERSSSLTIARLDISNPDSVIFKRYSKLFEGDKIPYFVLLDKRGRKIDAFAQFQTYNGLLEKLKKAYNLKIEN